MRMRIDKLHFCPCMRTRRAQNSCTDYPSAARRPCGVAPLIAALQLSHAKWFPSLPVRNFVLARIRARGVVFVI